MRDANDRLKNDAVKTMASRFASLPDYLRLEVAARLLRWHDENRASLLEKFWDEVERTHGDGLQCCNPFAAKS
ncbi:MAG TPA: hypothetical protein VGB73_01185 [Pyrinomonadaceae bacterium]